MGSLRERGPDAAPDADADAEAPLRDTVLNFSRRHNVINAPTCCAKILRDGSRADVCFANITRSISSVTTLRNSPYFRNISAHKNKPVFPFTNILHLLSNSLLNTPIAANEINISSVCWLVSCFLNISKVSAKLPRVSRERILALAIECTLLANSYNS